ncbi:hydroxysteroid 11-beta-dehydrogenase 1-like protein isoform 2-T5 [Alca torda]
MKPIGKVLCATGIVAGLLAFFWKDPFNPESLSGARVLLTGASAGIGEQMAYHYARFGAEIVLTARREAVLQKVMEKCLTLGAKKIFYIPADMSSPSEPEKVVQFAVQKLGGLDYLVLNHIGVTRFQMWSGDVAYTRWLMQVNFFSYVALATAAFPTLEKNKGSLVVVSSVTGCVFYSSKQDGGWPSCFLEDLYVAPFYIPLEPCSSLTMCPDLLVWFLSLTAKPISPAFLTQR